MKYTHKEWLEELKRRFGENKMGWAFKCPACGKVSTLQDFKDVGATPDDAYATCIGRHTGKGSPKQTSKDGCNWAAFGLFGTVGRGDEVVTESGKVVEVFAMADE